MPYPEAIFTLDYFRGNSKPFYILSKEFFNDKISFTIKNPAAIDVNYFIVNFENFFLDFGTQFVPEIAAIADTSNLSLGFANVVDPTVIASYTYPQDIEAYRQALLDPASWGPGFSLYWEKYLDIHKPGNFIIVVDTLVHSWFNWDASTGNAVTQLVGRDSLTTAWDDASNQTSPAKYLSLNAGAFREANTFKDKYWSANKFIQQDDIFIIESVKITYIRKPQKISLSLGLSCELPEHNHQEVVDMTVSSILEAFQDSRYQTNQIEEAKNK